MVLVLAALYTCYNNYQQHQQEQQQREQQQQGKEEGRGGEENVARLAATGLLLPSSSLHSGSVRTAGTTSSSSSSSLVASSQYRYRTMEEPVFRDSVREEWVLAVFGATYLRQPVGYGALGPSLGTYRTVTKALQKRPLAGESAPSRDDGSDRSHPAAQKGTSNSNSKLGMTLANVSVGLYVHHVVTGGEASLIGISPGAILVRVNHQCVVASSTKSALEQLWRYESQSATPVLLEFWCHSRQCSALLVTQQWGIAWAPAVQCCAVKRAYGQAAHAGIARGSWLLAVNRRSVATLEQARDALAESDDLELTLGFPPSPPVTPHVGDRDAPDDDGLAADGLEEPFFHPAQPPTRHHKLASSGAILSRRSVDGVRVKFHSLDTAITGLCQHIAATNLLAPMGSSEASTDVHVPASPSQYSASYWAHQVSTGQVVLESPPRNVLQTGSSTPHNNLHVLPFDSSQLLQAWDPLESVLFGLRMHSVGYQADALLQLLPAFAAGNDDDGDHHARLLDAAASQDQDSQGVLSSSSSDAATWMKQLVSKPLPAGMTPADLVGAFLLQFLGIICGTPATKDESLTDERDEKKGEEIPVSPAVIASTRTSWAAQHEVTSMLLRVSRKDQGFCQRLYFLLRSFLSTLESKKGSSTEVSTTALLALLNCLDRLRFAEDQSRTRLISQPSSRRDREAAQNNHVGTPKRKSLLGSPRREHQKPPSPFRPTADSAETPFPDYHPVKRKGLFGLFRKKKLSTAGSQTSKDSFPPDQPAPAMRTNPSSPQSDSSRVPESPAKSLSSRSEPSPSRKRNKDQSAAPSSPSNSMGQLSRPSVPKSPVVMYECMCAFLTELDLICSNIEKSLQKSFQQKMADWALQPWSPSKDSALGRVTQTMREHLRKCNAVEPGDADGPKPVLLVNPIDSSEILSTVDCDECYILPSAHFPILLTFDVSEQRCGDDLEGEELLYRTKVELVSIKAKVKGDGYFAVQAAVSGKISETAHPSHAMRNEKDGRLQHLYHIWPIGGVLSFESRSSWGAPQTLSLRVSQSASSGCKESQVLGYGWVDLSEQFSHSCSSNFGGASTVIQTAEIRPMCAFDEHGDAILSPDRSTAPQQSAELELKITTESIGIGEVSGPTGHRMSRKRMLLYKHDDDLRQEGFAVQFVKTCDAMLKASGLDLKLLTFQAVPVGTRRGFVEWIPGSVALSELCEPGTLLGAGEQRKRATPEDVNSLSLHSRAGLAKYESLRGLDEEGNDAALPRMGSGGKSTGSGTFYNPVQDYLRSVAFDPEAPYLIRKDVMDTYVKSCAGYSVITYILGVGDRHLDNLLLHQSGSFFHCDYSFILGSDPKAYLPVRITDDMVSGMGGKDSDNYARFVSMAGAAYLALRRPENVRLLLSLVRLMEHACLPDITENQTLDRALQGVRDRLRLDLTDHDAVAYLESLVEAAQSSRMAMAVDAIHSLGKKF